MIYPNNFERKLGFDEIRKLLKARCQSTLGQEKVDEMAFSTDADVVNEWLAQVREFRRLQEEHDDFPLQYFFDVRESIARIRLENTHLEEDEVWDLRRSLETIVNIVRYLERGAEETAQGDVKYPYPALHRLTDGVVTFPAMLRRIDSILDKFGKIKDSASMTLAGIRHDLEKTQGSISRTLYTILHAAQRDGLVDRDAAPAMRDGRLVIPVQPQLKRRISGIVHDESATGKTVFIEPTEVVEANNKVRQLEAEERREVIRILTVFTDEVRPYVREIIDSYQLLAQIDLIQAKAEWAKLTSAFEPTVKAESVIDWIRAVHPLLQLSLEKKGASVVPLDITLSRSEEGGVRKKAGRLLIISGPNAGGKSVCLKTVGLLQYMLQCGLPIPIGDRSTVGLFESIMIDIGDEQSIENDLSTYSSHLMNMKQMMRSANERSLLLIDEFGSGTEPTIGGAIAEAMLKQFWKKKTFGVITTHYQNLKHFAEDHEGVVNGAMLYDRHEMQALFQLSIGQPGSSFAIEIARKTGIPEEVIRDASDIVGQDYIQSDKYLQDIVRDKRYWEGKRQTIHQHEKKLEATGERLEAELTEIERQRKEILRKAKEEAEEMLRESNKRIENAIREIREQQAEKERTRKIREELDAFKEEVAEIDTRANDEAIARKIRQLQERKERREKRKAEKAEKAASAPGRLGQGETSPASMTSTASIPLKLGDTVRIKGLTSVGVVDSIDGKMAVVIFGGMKTKMRADRLEHAEKPKTSTTKAEERNQNIAGSYGVVSRDTRNVIDNRKLNFKQDIDVRGMRGDEAINAITYFIDDAILVGVSRVRILHGTGTGILRQLIRQYLATIPNVTHYRDEHVQFGGSGITVVDLE
ncbi:endonuclease MutS2 [Xylanibacter ruminicola]|uniref:Endonuclease MutS2 n=1 Tax=Xylanibacter ruminicola TaxID=839 RepID=A0A1M6TVE6_XYLRU|nr:Smr/MutS family protein [Xylanibacter ruminicola]SHK60860.1 DNA mismatch repair protein MutS2 [Xylanibacter ruminicola]